MVLRPSLAYTVARGEQGSRRLSGREEILDLSRGLLVFVTTISRVHRSNMVRGVATRAVTIAACFVLSAAGQAQSPPPASTTLPDIEARLDVARTAVKKHATRLKQDLTQALKDNGAKGAIGSCVSISPDIDAAVSDEHHVEIGRTSTRVRNTENAPDDWELAGLEAFAKQIADGGDPHKLEVFDVTTTTEGQRLFRYMKPIMMQEMCLTCHGSNLPQDLKSEIAKSYPDDKAVGFNLNELRGAFTLVQRID